MIVTYCSSGVPVDYTALQKIENKIICAGCRCLQIFRRRRKWVWCFCSSMFFVTQMLFAPWYVNNLLSHCGKPPLYQIVVSSYALSLNSMCDHVKPAALRPAHTSKAMYMLSLCWWCSWNIRINVAPAPSFLHIKRQTKSTSGPIHGGWISWVQHLYPIWNLLFYWSVIIFTPVVLLIFHFSVAVCPGQTEISLI